MMRSGVVSMSVLAALQANTAFIRFRFHARHTKLHSPRAPLIPRTRMAAFHGPLDQPDTGSTVHLRKAYSLRPRRVCSRVASPPVASAWVAAAPGRQSARTARHDGLRGRAQSGARSSPATGVDVVLAGIPAIGEQSLDPPQILRQGVQLFEHWHDLLLVVGRLGECGDDDQHTVDIDGGLGVVALFETIPGHRHDARFFVGQLIWSLFGAYSGRRRRSPAGLLPASSPVARAPPVLGVVQGLFFRSSPAFESWSWPPPRLPNGLLGGAILRAGQYRRPSPWRGQPPPAFISLHHFRLELRLQLLGVPTTPCAMREALALILVPSRPPYPSLISSIAWPKPRTCRNKACISARKGLRKWAIVS